MSTSSHMVITIGRDIETNDIVIPANVVSSNHAQIRYDSEVGYVVQDLNSSNGTWVIHGGTALAVQPGASVRLSPGALIRFGQHVAFEVTELTLQKLLHPRRAHSPLFMAETPQTTQANLQIFAPAEHLSSLASGQVQNTLENASPQRSRQPSRRGGTRDTSEFQRSGSFSANTKTVGSHPDCDVVIHAPMVSGKHFEITLDTGETKALVRDLNSTNGLYLNSHHQQIRESTILEGDVLFLGSYRLPARLLFAQLREVSTGSQLLLPDQGSVTLGREGAGADIGIPAAHISARHAEVRIEGHKLYLRDLGSRNGTWVNGRRITREVQVQPSDRVSLGSYEILLEPGKSVAPKTYAGKITLRCDNVEVTVPDKGGTKKLIHDTSLTIYPTEFVGLMGPSGAGKTTLLRALNGYSKPSAGSVYINSSDLYSNYEHYRGEIGYVPQEDIVFPSLTVYQSLKYTAKLRLPADTSNQEIDARIHSLLERLDIAGTRDVIIGDALQKGISGGQRKRVNLAQELLTDPSLLFLDEPTSGLASGDTLQVMGLLRQLADEGRTIILTIHQPSAEAYGKMDQVIYLHNGGHLAYFGPTEESIEYFHPGNREIIDANDPSDAMKPLAEDLRTTDENDRARAIARRAKAYRQSSQYDKFVVQRKTAALPEYTGDQNVRENKPGLLRQAFILASRMTAIKKSDIANTAILLLQAPIIAALLVLVFFDSFNIDSDFFDQTKAVHPLLFMLVASSVWFGCNNAAREIVSEQAIYRRERMVNLRIDSYVLSKIMVLCSMTALQCAVLLGLSALVLDIQGPFHLIALTLIFCGWVGVGIGLLLSAIVRSQEAAVALVPIILIPQIVLGGLLTPHYEQNAFVRAASAMTVTRWGFEAILNAERNEETTEDIAQACGFYDSSNTQCLGSYGSLPCTFDHATQRIANCGTPQNTPECLSLCDSLLLDRAITPVDRIFGPASTDPLREKLAPIREQINADPVFQPTRSGNTWMESIYSGWMILGTMFLILILFIDRILRFKDPRPRAQRK